MSVEIINVIEIYRGITNPPKSFIIIDEKDKDQIVEKAEQMFLTMAREHGCKPDEFTDDDLLDDSYWDNNNGYEVILNWSEIQNRIEISS